MVLWTTRTIRPISAANSRTAVRGITDWMESRGDTALITVNGATLLRNAKVIKLGPNRVKFRIIRPRGRSIRRKNLPRYFYVRAFVSYLYFSSQRSVVRSLYWLSTGFSPLPETIECTEERWFVREQRRTQTQARLRIRLGPWRSTDAREGTRWSESLCPPAKKTESGAAKCHNASVSISLQIYIL